MLFRDRPQATPAPVSYTHLDVYKRQGVHKQRHQKTFPDAQSGVGGEDAEGKADGEITEHDRQAPKKPAGNFPREL